MLKLAGTRILARCSSNPTRRASCPPFRIHPFHLMRNYKNMILSRNLQSEQNLNPCTGMSRRSQSEHLASWCSFLATIARRGPFSSTCTGGRGWLGSESQIEIRCKIVFVKFDQILHPQNKHSIKRHSEETQTQRTKKLFKSRRWQLDIRL